MLEATREFQFASVALDTIDMKETRADNQCLAATDANTNWPVMAHVVKILTSFDRVKANGSRSAMMKDSPNQSARSK